MKQPIIEQLNKLTYLINRLGKQLLKQKFSLSFSEFVVLGALLSQEKVRQKQIIQSTGLSKGMVSRVIEKLEQKKLLTASENSKNRREDAVSLTASGKKLAQTSSEYLNNQLEQNVLAKLTANERTTFSKVLEKLLASV